MPSSADEVDAALSSGVDRIESAIAALEPEITPIVLIDGRSGAGKSTLARRVRERWGRPVSMIGLDELYPGWDGLSAGSTLAREFILIPVSEARAAVWRRWDWTADRPGAEVETPADVPLILEGAGVLTPSTAPLAHVRVWVESPENARRDRALARDGDTYRPHWRRWADQEEEHLRAHRPQSLATIVIDVP